MAIPLNISGSEIKNVIIIVVNRNKSPPLNHEVNHEILNFGLLKTTQKTLTTMITIEIVLKFDSEEENEKLNR